VFFALVIVALWILEILSILGRSAIIPLRLLYLADINMLVEAGLNVIIALVFIVIGGIILHKGSVPEEEHTDAGKMKV
jgi:hypothetical protein